MNISDNALLWILGVSLLLLVITFALALHDTSKNGESGRFVQFVLKSWILYVLFAIAVISLVVLLGRPLLN